MSDPVLNYTVALVKAPTVRRGDDAVVFKRLMDEGIIILALQRGLMCPTTIRAFYGAHVDKPYFKDLEWSVTGPVVSMLLFKPGEDVVSAWRDLMGPTDPAKAPKGTLRGLIGGFAYNGANAKLADNAVHGSDSYTAAQYEASLLFPKHVVWRVEQMLKDIEDADTIITDLENEGVIEFVDPPAVN